MPDQFQTERLAARPLTGSQADIDLLTELNADVEVMRYITGRAMTAEQSAADAKSSLGTRWLLFRLDDDRFVGWVGAAPTARAGVFDIGWRLQRAAWGQGFATESARALIECLFAEGANGVVANTMAVNQRSRSVMERIGLTYLRTFHLHFDDPLPGTEHGEVEYAMTRA